MHLQDPQPLTSGTFPISGNDNVGKDDLDEHMNKNDARKSQVQIRAKAANLSTLFQWFIIYAKAKFYPAKPC